MYDHLCEIENMLFMRVPVGVRRLCSRYFDGMNITLSFDSNFNLSVIIRHDNIQIDYLEESEIFDISTYGGLCSSISIIARFLEELMTGTLLFEKVYRGHTQIRQRISLIGSHSCRNIKTISNPAPSNSRRETQLVMVEKAFFCKIF